MRPIKWTLNEKCIANKIESRELWKVHKTDTENEREKIQTHKTPVNEEKNLNLYQCYIERERESSRCRRRRRRRSRCTCTACVLNVLLFARRAMPVPNVWVFVQRSYDEKFMNKEKKEQPAKPSSNSSTSTISVENFTFTFNNSPHTT